MERATLLMAALLLLALGALHHFDRAEALPLIDEPAAVPSRPTMTAAPMAPVHPSEDPDLLFAPCPVTRRNLPILGDRDA